MDTSLRLYFKTDQDKNTSIKIPEVKTSYNINTIRGVMLEMAYSGMVKNKQGTFTSPLKARLNSVSSVDFNV